MVWQFHPSCHGKNITVGPPGTKAVRSHITDDNGIIFSKSQIQAEETVSLYFKKTTYKYTSVPQIGFTNQNPDLLDPTSLPPNYTENITYPSLTLALPLEQASKILSVDYNFDESGTVFVRQLGQLYKLLNPKGAVDFKKPVWATVDLCGGYTSVFNHAFSYIPQEIDRRGPEARELYQKALQRGSKAVWQAPMMLVGDYRVGKTSLIKTLTGQKYNPVEPSTEEIDAFAVTFKNGNPTDSWHICSTDDKERSETNSEDGSIILDVWDISSMHQYFTAQQIFPSCGWIVLLVFNLMSNLDTPLTTVHNKNNLALLNTWMHLVRAHAVTILQSAPSTKQTPPKIVIIGTRRNSLGKDELERQTLIEAKFARIRALVKHSPYHQHFVSRFFAVENNLQDPNDAEVMALRKLVEDLTQSEQFSANEIPLKWLQFDATRHVSRPILSLPMLKRSFGNLIGDMAEDEIQLMLQYYHDLGHIYYDSVGEVIFMDLRLLVQTVMKFVTIQRPKKMSSALKRSWNRLNLEGVMEKSLMDHMLGDKLSGVQEEDVDTKQAVVDLMCRLDLMCRRNPPPNQEAGAGGGEKPARWGTSEYSYILPSFVLTPIPPHIKKMLSCDLTSFYIHAKQPWHVFFFNRLVVRVFRWSQEHGKEEPKLAGGYISFFIDVDHEVHIEMLYRKHASIKVTISKPPVFKTSVQRQLSQQGSGPSNMVTRKVKELLVDILDPDKCPWLKGIKLCFYVRCPCDPEGALHFLSISECLEKERITCDKEKRIDTSGVKEVFMDSNPKPSLKVGTAESSTQDLQLHVPSEGQSKYDPHVMEEVHLIKIAGEIGKEWERLGMLLGFKAQQLYRFKSDNLLSTDNRISRMLVAWSQKEEGHVREKVEKLGKALVECDRKEVKENMLDPYM